MCLGIVCNKIKWKWIQYNVNLLNATMWKKIAFKDGIVWDHCQKYWYTLRKHVFDSKHQIVDYFSDIVSADILFLHCFLVVILFYLSLELAFIFSGSKEAVAHRCSVKKAFLEIPQNSQENTCQSLFFNKVVYKAYNLLLY